MNIHEMDDIRGIKVFTRLLGPSPDIAPRTLSAPTSST